MNFKAALWHNPEGVRTTLDVDVKSFLKTTDCVKVEGMFQ